MSRELAQPVGIAAVRIEIRPGQTRIDTRLLERAKVRAQIGNASSRSGPDSCPAGHLELVGPGSACGHGLATACRRIDDGQPRVSDDPNHRLQRRPMYINRADRRSDD